jgi:hypothetical protein
VLDCGRRFGKDIMQRNYACEGVFNGDAVSWYEPEYKSLLENWEWFCKTLLPVNRKKSEQEKRIDLTNRGYIEMWSLQDKDASRGRHYKRVIINEAAKVPYLEYSWNNVIRITLMDLAGGAMFGSTPKGINYFKSLYDRGNDPHEKEWASFKRSTYDNPFIPVSEIEEVKRTVPEIVFQQEIMGEFINMEGAVFRRIQEAAVLEPLEGPIEKHTYVAGVDVAASVDYTVVSIFDADSKDMVFMDRFNRVDYNVLEDRLAAVNERWHLVNMTIEANSIGQGVIDHLRTRGVVVIPFTTTSSTKQTIIQGLQSAFEHNLIKILNNPVMIGELLSFESKRTASGGFTYSAPEGMHDDTVMALAIGYHGLLHPSKRGSVDDWR